MAPFVTGVAARRSSDTAPGGAFHVLPGRSLCRAAFGQLGLFRNLFLQVSAQAFRCVGFSSHVRSSSRSIVSRDPSTGSCCGDDFGPASILPLAGSGAEGRFRHLQLPFVRRHTSTFGMKLWHPRPTGSWMICSETGPCGVFWPFWPARISFDPLPGPGHSRRLKVRLRQMSRSFLPNLTLGSPHSQAAVNL